MKKLLFGGLIAMCAFSCGEETKDEEGTDQTEELTDEEKEEMEGVVDIIDAL